MCAKFGIEIEFNNATPSVVANALTQEGIRCSNESYNHTTRSYWKATTDGSLAYHDSCELVSPPLRVTEESFANIRHVCAILNGQLEVSVNRTCGLHVHLDISHLNIAQIINVYERYKKFEKDFDSLMPRSRRETNNTYCQSLQHVVLERMTTVQDLRGIYWERYRKINFLSLAKYGTLEFRQHSGTTNAEKIINWVKFLIQFVAEAARIAPPAPPAPLTDEQKFMKKILASGSRRWSFTEIRNWQRETDYKFHMTPKDAMYALRKDNNLLLKKVYGMDAYQTDDLYVLMNQLRAILPVEGPVVVPVNIAPDTFWSGIDNDLVVFYQRRQQELRTVPVAAMA